MRRSDDPFIRAVDVFMVGVLGGAVIAVVIAVAVAVWPDPRGACLRSHVETHHRGRWIQWINSGKTIIPIFHAARDVEVEVCDQWER